MNARAEFRLADPFGIGQPAAARITIKAYENAMRDAAKRVFHHNPQIRFWARDSFHHAKQLRNQARAVLAIHGDRK